MGDLGSIFVLALWAMFNPTLLAAVTVMMLLPNTKKLMFGYLLGAYLTSITLGLLIVFSLHDSGGVSTARHTLSPIQDLVFGALLLVVGTVLRTGKVDEMRERRRQRKPEEPKKESWPERMLGRGSARVTFAVGAALTLPGVAYLTALNRTAELEWAAFPTVLVVVAFCLFQQLLLELPLIGYWLAPERTQRAVTGFRGWLARNGRRAAGGVAVTLGALLIVRGVVTLLT
ncbi:MAG TPA: GAP family protein [Solirubrobacterales bacterium]|nr:GAP family protein [Solirubrobacterales bacterium]